MKNTLKDLESGFDSEVEHSFHSTYQEGCSTCWSEAMIIQYGAKLISKGILPQGAYKNGIN